MNADGSNQRNISNDASNDIRPSWSPDGTQIAFTSNRDGYQQIYVMDADGGNQWNISNNSSSGDYYPAGSPVINASEVTAISPFGQCVVVFLLGGATALYLNRKRESAGA